MIKLITANLYRMKKYRLKRHLLLLVGNEIQTVIHTMETHHQELFLSEYLLPISAAGILEAALLYVFAYYAVKNGYSKCKKALKTSA